MTFTALHLKREKREKTKFIHVNQMVIKHNRKYGNVLPPCRVQYGKSGKSRYCMEVIINGESRMVYRPKDPLACGAQLWIQTNDIVELIGEVSYAEIKDKMHEFATKKVKNNPTRVIQGRFDKMRRAA